MSQTTIEQFLGRILTDSAFLEQITNNEDGRGEAFKQGYIFSDTEWGALKAIDLKKIIENTPSIINNRIKRGQNRASR